MEPDEARALAVFVIAQLPKMTPADMLTVLAAAEALVRLWYCQTAEILPFPEPPGSSPMRRAKPTDKSS